MNESDCLFSFNQRAASKNIEDFPSSLLALFQGADCGSPQRATCHLCSNTFPFFFLFPPHFFYFVFFFLLPPLLHTHTHTLTSFVQNGVRNAPLRFVSHFSAAEANSKNTSSQFGSDWLKSCTCTSGGPPQVGPSLRRGSGFKRSGKGMRKRFRAIRADAWQEDTVGTLLGRWDAKKRKGWKKAKGGEGGLYNCILI